MVKQKIADVLDEIFQEFAEIDDVVSYDRALPEEEEENIKIRNKKFESWKNRIMKLIDEK